MSRGKKLLIVGVVLIVGFGLAWPFRKTAADKAIESAARAPAVDINRAMAESIPSPSDQLAPLGFPAPHVVAKMTGMAESVPTERNSSPTTSFDLANHPALASPQATNSASPVMPPVPPNFQASPAEYLPARVQKFRGNTRPAYSTVDRDRGFAAEEERQTEMRHIVQNSDTLEKLAKRYLGDEGRALEIFDLNRDLLDNPHLLPIDAQLRIPSDVRNNVEAERSH